MKKNIRRRKLKGRHVYCTKQEHDRRVEEVEAIERKKRKRRLYWKGIGRQCVKKTVPSLAAALAVGLFKKALNL